MSTQTPNLDMQKDAGTDNYDILVVNANLDKVDAMFPIAPALLTYVVSDIATLRAAVAAIKVLPRLLAKKVTISITANMTWTTPATDSIIINGFYGPGSITITGSYKLFGVGGCGIHIYNNYLAGGVYMSSFEIEDTLVGTPVITAEATIVPALITLYNNPGRVKIFDVDLCNNQITNGSNVSINACPNVIASATSLATWKKAYDGVIVEKNSKFVYEKLTDGSGGSGTDRAARYGIIIRDGGEAGNHDITYNTAFYGVTSNEWIGSAGLYKHWSGAAWVGLFD